MDRITLDKANKINESIRYIEAEINGWKKSINFFERPLCLTDGGEKVRVCINHLDFIKIKEMAIAELERRLENLQEEFKKL